jgi:hypothetical protein
MAWIILVIVALLIYSYPQKSLLLFRSTARFLISVFNPKKIEYWNEFNLLMTPVHEAINKVKVAQTGSELYQIFSSTLNELNTTPFLRKWENYIESNSSEAKNNHPVHNGILELLDAVLTKNCQFDDKQGLKYILLARDCPSLRSTLEWNVKYTPPGIICTFAAWCNQSDRTAFIRACTADPTFLKVLYANSGGDSKLWLIQSLIRSQDEGFALISDHKVRWEIIQQSNFWLEWPSTESESKYEASRVIDEFIVSLEKKASF